MNTKVLMTTNAILMGVTGLILCFLPQEVSNHLSQTEINLVIMQILGALYFGFAMLTWATKETLIGGIYSRPVAIANFTHFLIGGLALDKLALNSMTSAFTWIAGIIYSIFAILFGYILFTNPVLKNKAL